MENPKDGKALEKWAYKRQRVATLICPRNLKFTMLTTELKDRPKVVNKHNLNITFENESEYEGFKQIEGVKKRHRHFSDPL